MMSQGDVQRNPGAEEKIPTDFAAFGRLRWRVEDRSSISASGGRDAPRRVGKAFGPKNSPGTAPTRSGAVEGGGVVTFPG
jgi:hypothetical protein